MANNNVFRWLDGRGWLVLSGGQTQGSEVRAQAIGRMSADGGVAYITMGSGSHLGERALADMEDLGAPSGYLVDVQSEDDDTIRQKLADAGLIVVESASDLSDLRSSLLGAAVDGMKTAFENGAVILAEGASISVFGAWFALEDGPITSGLEWLENGVVISGVISVADSDEAQEILKYQPSGIAIGIGAGSAFALGPDGEVETWGEKRVGVALGPAYGA